jgi:hypothetical protein
VTETTTSPLARMQETWSGWRTTRNIPGVAPEPGFTAVERATGRRFIATTLTEMEALLTAEGETGSRIGQRLPQGENGSLCADGQDVTAPALIRGGELGQAGHDGVEVGVVGDALEVMARRVRGLQRADLLVA